MNDRSTALLLIAVALAGYGVVVLLGVSIAATWLVEGFVLGIVAYLHAMLVAVLAIVVALIIAAYINRPQEEKGEGFMTVRLVRRLILVGIMGVWLSVLPIPARAQVDIRVGIQLPPPLVFSAPPQVVVLPETYVYVVPDIDEDVFFVDGWWWRPWQGRWYRSRYYDRGWGYYSRVPSFYREIPQDWRHEYRDHQWRGQAWSYERMPHEHVEKNWNAWKRDKYWEQHQTWGVQGLKPQRQGHGQQPQAPQSERHGQRPQAPQSERHGQQPQAQQQRSQKPSRNQGDHGQGNRGHGQGKASQQHGGKEDH